MELPYTGRATFDDNFGNVTITIPTKKNWFIIAFFCIWICGGFLGETTVSGSIFNGNTGGAGAFEIIWLCGWTLGGAFALSIVIWNIFGKEIITVSPGALTIQRKGTIFFKAKTYDLHEAHNFRAEQVPQYDNYYRNRSLNNAFNPNNGTIKFDYGMQTIRFADNMD